MFKPLLITFISLLTIFSGSSQTEPEGIPFVAYWSIGDQFKYAVEKVSIKMKDGIITENDTTRYTAVFSVIDSTATSYQVKYAMENDFSSQFPNGEIPEELEDFKSLDVIINTDELGAFIGIENWKEVSDQLVQLSNKLIDNLISSGVMTVKDKDKYLENLLTAITSQEAIEQLTFQELQLMLFPFGAELPTKNSLKYEELLPNLIGGDPLRADSEISIEDIDEEETTCTVTHTLDINKNDTKRMINDFFKTLDLGDKDLENAMKKAKYDIHDVTVSSYQYDYGLPLSISYLRELEVSILKEQTTQLKEITIELLEVL